MDLSSKSLLIGGQSSNLYIYNMEEKEYEEDPDRGDITTGMYGMDLDTGE